MHDELPRVVSQYWHYDISSKETSELLLRPNLAEYSTRRTIACLYKKESWCP